jgi:8-amino-3,8-dideoxy-alpha-D-manno-octulosonate transaminase
MRASKRRIKAALAGTPGLCFQRLNDEAGDAGPFLVLMLDNESKAKSVVKRMQEAGLASSVRLAEYGMHIYYHVQQLVRKVPLSPAGNPWSLPQNEQSVWDYQKGACPHSDGLFARSILLPIPSRLTLQQEKAAAEIIKSAMKSAGKLRLTSAKISSSAGGPRKAFSRTGNGAYQARKSA